MVAVAYNPKSTAFGIGDYVRKGNSYSYIEVIDRGDAILTNGKRYWLGELKLIQKAPIQSTTDFCDICEEFASGVETKVIEDDALNICASCRAASEAINREPVQQMHELEYTRPAQALVAGRLELIPPCAANGVKIADLVMEAENTHAVSQIAGLLPAPTATSPVPTDPTPKFNLGDYVVIDASHDIYYGCEGKITYFKATEWRGQTLFVYTVDTLCTNIPEGQLHPATPEKPAAYLAFQKFSNDKLYLGKLVFIHADAGYVIYGSYASVVESVIKRRYKGQWLPSGVYELFIPMKDMPQVQKDILSWGKFFVRLNLDGTQPPLFPVADASYMVVS